MWTIKNEKKKKTFFPINWVSHQNIYMILLGTPMWRVGPKDKPVLCNACGSRYRKRGNLEDYDPGHSEKNHKKNLIVSCYQTGNDTNTSK